jgi:hypothetical protein
MTTWPSNYARSNLFVGVDAPPDDGDDLSDPILYCPVVSVARLTNQLRAGRICNSGRGRRGRSRLIVGLSTESRFDFGASRERTPDLTRAYGRFQSHPLVNADDEVLLLLGLAIEL